MPDIDDVIGNLGSGTEKFIKEIVCEIEESSFFF